MRENRKEARKRTKEWGKIVLVDKEMVFNCTITDVSQSGACLRVGLARVPDEFHFLRKVTNTLYRVVVRSRRYEAIGVQFVEPLDPNSEDASRVHRTIDAQKRAPLRRGPLRSDGREIFTSFDDTGLRRRADDRD
jgi:hypothetical protein